MEILLHLCLKSLKVFKVFVVLLAVLGLTLFTLWFFYTYVKIAIEDKKKVVPQV